ncbi:aldo/keto reductase [Pseudonocardiaceae bacterium YIM PH 21723]|nr:aldo/keto reductase [Pseudonocardiaceae bacterium YIM PH 21723]
MVASPVPRGPTCYVASMKLPKIGFGTAKLSGTQCVEAIAGALDAGYRLLDSAFNYANEGAVGAAVRRSSIPREDILVTSKLPGRYYQRDLALPMVQESVYRTGLEYIDLYLLHWPNPSTDLYVEAWQTLVEARQQGLVREIGVCNFLPEHLERIERETGVRPVVNQIELHPYFPQTEALAHHADRGILTQSWCPLRRGDLLEHPVITGVAAEHGITPAQAVLAWHVAVGAIPLPRSASAERQRENLAATEIRLRPADVDRITALGRPDGRLKDQDPAVYEEY